MTKPVKLVVFGAGEMAELATFYFNSDTQYEVVGYTLDDDYVSQAASSEAPTVPFSRIEDYFPPSEFCLFIALGYSRLNSVRKEKFLQAKEKGYSLPSYISPRANILNDGNIGENCFVLEDNTVQPFVSIGDNVTLWSGNHIGHHSTIGDHTFIASHVVISGGVSIGESCFLGVNSTIRDRLQIGDRCVIGAGAILLQDAEAEGLYAGSKTERSAVPTTKLRRI